MQEKTMPSEPIDLSGRKNLLIDIYVLQSVMKVSSHFCKILHS